MRRVVILTAFGVLVATPVLAQPDQSNQVPAIGRKLLNGILQNNQGRDSRYDDEQGRGYRQGRSPSDEDRGYSHRDDRDDGDRGRYRSRDSGSYGNDEDRRSYRDSGRTYRRDDRDRDDRDRDDDRSDRGQD